MLRPIRWAYIIALVSLMSFAQPYNRTVSTSNLYTGSVTVPSNLSIYSPLPISFNISDASASAYSNVTVAVDISGPQSHNLSFTANPLAPGQVETVSVSIPNATLTAGTYTVYVNSSYIENGTRYRSGSGAQFTVWLSRYAVLPGVSVNFTPLQDVNITYFPLFSYLNANSSSLSQIGVQGTSSNAVYVNFSVPQEFSQMLTFSSAMLYVKPGQEIESTMLFNPPSSAQIQAYLVPISITEQGSGTAGIRHTQYADFYTVANYSRAPIIYNQAYLTGNMRNAGGVVQAYAPSSNGLSGTTIKLLLSSSVAGSAANITAYGSQSDVTIQGGRYVIQWDVGRIPAGGNKYLYYSINGIKNKSAVSSADTVLISSDTISTQNLFKLVSSTLPEFYTNYTDNVTVQLKYTGSAPSTVDVALTAPLGITVTNATQPINATPNQLITRRFAVSSGTSPGTYILTLTAATGGSNAVFSLPIIVIQGAPPGNTPLNSLGGLLAAFKYVLVAILAMATVAALYLKRAKGGHRIYRPDMARNLIRVREQMRNYREQ